MPDAEMTNPRKNIKCSCDSFYPSDPPICAGKNNVIHTY